MPARPPFIRSTSEVPERAHAYPQSVERMGPVRRLGKEAGLQRIGVNVQRISHCFINNTSVEAVLLVGGEAVKPGSRIFYPLKPSRRADMAPSNWWHDVPERELGPHDGLPDAKRGERP
jgi:uncharacterized cupin superfamily protein